MAKISVVQRELKRALLVKRFLKKRLALNAALKEVTRSPEQKRALRLQLQKLPRSSSPVRLHRRCKMTGRPHGVYRKFGLARTKIREAAMRGDIPGLVKASW